MQGTAAVPTASTAEAGGGRGQKEHAVSTLAVGQPYRHGRTSWPETLQAYIGPTYCELTSFYNGPTSSEIAAYRSGPVAFALAVAGPHVLVIAVQYGDLPWVDMPFEVHRIDPAGRGVPAGDPYEPLWIRSVLVDASTVHALRIDAVEGEFAGGLRAAVWER